MICVSIGNPNPEQCATLFKSPHLHMAEIRLDGAELSHDQIRSIFTSPIPLIATCRPTPHFNDTQRQEILLTAIEAGAAYIDIEIDAKTDYLMPLLKAAHTKKCAVIISYHNHETTPSNNTLNQILHQSFCMSATIAKIACLTHTLSDCARLLSLYGIDLSMYVSGDISCPQIVVLGMGEMGKITRLAAPLLGAPFTFAASEAGQETAPGQMTRQTLETIYGLLK